MVQQNSEIDGGNVLMGNNQSCKIEGIDTISMKMFDGIVRTLKDVRYIPTLKRNLVSHGELDDIGFFWRAESGILKVVKESMVVMKGAKKQGLYEVVGEIVVEGNSAAGLITKEENTMLWHNRLGHMSEKGL